MESSRVMDCPLSFTPIQFYGKSRKQKRRQEAIAKKLGQNAIKLPSALSHRILGPTNCWKIFYRQTEAFSWARQTAEDVMVFAFENTDRDPTHTTGQRRYLVTSLHVFWHYYSQMDPSKRHHYEIIPEGWPCRLYFDLEFLKHLNPGCDGERMVDVLIQYVCVWLEAVFNLCCNRSCVLDLDASTESKFSRHLIFHVPGAVFVNCVAAGNFIRHIFGLLVKYIKLKSNELNISPTVLYEHCSRQHQGVPNCIKSQPNIDKNCDFGEISDEDFIVAAQICEEAISQRCNVPTARTNDREANQDIDCLTIQYRTNAISSVAVKCGTNSTSRPVPLEIRINHECNSADLSNGTNNISSLTMQTGITNDINVEEKQNLNHVLTSDKIEQKYGGTNRGSLSDCTSNSGESVVPCTSCLTKSYCTDDDMQSSTNEMMRICGQFSLNDLQSLLVSNSDGNMMTFSDLGVYTKNRNFRLYLSSKLNKNNPLTLAASNQFVPGTSGKMCSEQAVFHASLVSNIRYTSDVQILTFGNQRQQKCLTTEIPRSVNYESTHREDFLEGRNCPSPYPEIDGFIESLTWSHGCRGRVRHWMHFRSSDSFMYDITGCRFCWNVQREHRSNNVMYIVDLRRGIYYQKCYDPDCQAVGYRSKAMEIPGNLLPSSFFEAAWDDDDEWDDDVGNSFNGDIKDNSSRLSEYHEDRNRLSEYHEDSNRLSEYHEDRDRLGEYHEDSNRLSEYHEDRDRLGEYHVDRDRLGEYHVDSNRLSEYHEDSNRLSEYHEDRDRLSEYHEDINRFSEYHEDSNRLSEYHEDRDRLGEYHVVDNWRQDDILSEQDELKWTDHVSSFDDEDDDLLLAATEEVELGCSQLTQIPGLAAAPGKEDEDFDDDDAFVTAAEEVEMNFHPDMYSKT